jgi:large subunit ribosomal protein L19
MNNLIKEVQNELNGNYKAPDFSAGATVTVHYKIKEGNKERIQQVSRRCDPASRQWGD